MKEKPQSFHIKCHILLLFATDKRPGNGFYPGRYYMKCTVPVLLGMIAKTKNKYTHKCNEREYIVVSIQCFYLVLEPVYVRSS